MVAVLSNPDSQLHRYPDGRTIHLVGVVFEGHLDESCLLGDGCHGLIVAMSSTMRRRGGFW